MKKTQTIKRQASYLLIFLLIGFLGCERDFSEDVTFAGLSTDGSVFIDTFTAGLDYFPFVNDGADPFAFEVVNDEVFSGTSSMRFDVPTFGNGFVGATFNTTVRRDLSGFDALTFYAKASQAATINEIGFGIDVNTNNKFITSVNGLALTTNWKKYTIPLPDPSKLTDIVGLLYLSEGASSETDEGGYVFWLDDVQFEKLGTVAQPRPSILGGVDIQQEGFLDTSLTISQLTQTFNLANGTNQTVNVAPSYYDFSSSNVNVAFSSELGVVSIIDEGTATITAQLGGVLASGSLTLNVSGTFNSAPTPPSRNQEDVISIFSDAYTNVDNLNFVAFNDSSLEAQAQTFNNDQIVTYRNFEFVGLGWDGTVDVSGLTHIHLDVQLVGAPSSTLDVQLVDFGSNDTDDGLGQPTDDTAGGFNATSQLVEGQWVGIDIPLSSFTLTTGGGGLGNPNLNNVGYVVLVSNFGSFIVDNIYFYKN